MFELFVAWTIFTAVLGKSTEAAIHAWKGTTPPGHAERMARIRAREAKAARRPEAPSEGFRGWARLIWVDAWNAAAERHRERWPDKAEKMAASARQRWTWWDGVEAESAQRWEARRRERERQRARRERESAERVKAEADQAWAEAQRAKAEAARATRQARDARRQEEARRKEEEAHRKEEAAKAAKASAQGDPPDEEPADRGEDTGRDRGRDADATADEGGSYEETADGSTWYTHPGPGVYDGYDTHRSTAAAQRLRRAQERARRAEEQARQAAAFARRAQERAEQAERRERAAAGPTVTVTPEPTPDEAGVEEDIPDAEIVYPELEAAPASADTPTDTAPAPEADTTSQPSYWGLGTFDVPFDTTDEEKSMSDSANPTNEILGLDSSLKFAEGVVAVSTENVSNTEQAVAAMENGKVGDGPVGKAKQLMEAMDAVKTLAEELHEDLAAMKVLQEMYDANPDAGDKEFLGAGR
ncbi:hypothetical protein ACFWZ7_24795 [Nocardiopsis alba]|uniref:hypothetical protein n=1 Tax=Nocardiopsis alba TaxID=53437 RepID=UPI00366EA082